MLLNHNLALDLCQLYLPLKYSHQQYSYTSVTIDETDSGAHSANVCIITILGHVVSSGILTSNRSAFECLVSVKDQRSLLPSLANQQQSLRGGGWLKFRALSSFASIIDLFTLAPTSASFDHIEGLDILCCRKCLQRKQCVQDKCNYQSAGSIARHLHWARLWH